MLRPLDIVVLLKLHLLGPKPPGQMQVARLLGISSRSVNEALKRGTASRLYSQATKSINRMALADALTEGIRYFMPPKIGAVSRGVPTAAAAPPLSAMLTATDEPMVWAHPEGTLRGVTIEPLHPCVPNAALADPELHELLALVDTIRAGTAREVELAKRELRARLVP